VEKEQSPIEYIRMNGHIKVGYNPQRLNLTSHKVFRTSPNEPIIDYSYDYHLGTGTNNGWVQKITANLDATYTTTDG